MHPNTDVVYTDRRRDVTTGRRTDRNRLDKSSRIERTARPLPCTAAALGSKNLLARGGTADSAAAGFVGLVDQFPKLGQQPENRLRCGYCRGFLEQRADALEGRTIARRGCRWLYNLSHLVR